MLDTGQIENDLIEEIKLTRLQAKVFLLIVNEGKMNSEKIAKRLDITVDKALTTCKQLIDLGSFIDYSESEFEAMHPRFTAVNMYRKMCQREKKEFTKNVKVDNIGIALEKPYDDARTK